MDKSVNKVLLGSTTLLALGATAQQAQAATLALSARAEILAPIQITQDDQMNFGILTDGGAGGTATLGTGDTITGTTGATNAAGGTVTSGEFTLKGTTGRQINITTPASVNLVNGGNSVTVHSFALLAPGGAGGANNTGTAALGANIAATLGAATSGGFFVGGTLVVGAAQATGTYTGNVTITAVYN